MDQVQVGLVDAEPPKALLGFGSGVLTTGIELGGNERLAGGHAAVAQPQSYAFLVAVSLGRVDVAITELERPAHRVHALRPVRHLPDAQAQHGHLVAVREDAGAPVVSYCADWHGDCSLTLGPGMSWLGGGLTFCPPPGRAGL